MKKSFYLFLIAASLTVFSSSLSFACDHSRLNTLVMLDDREGLKASNKDCRSLSSLKDPVTHRTLLHTAAEFSSLQSMRFLLALGASPNSLDFHKVSPLHLVRDAKVASALLQAGANPNLIDQWNRTPFRAVLEGENIELLDLLRAQGARIRAQDIEWASSYNKFAALNYLAERGTVQEIRGTGRYFRLFYFYDDNYQALARKFVAKGADLNQAKTVGSQKSLLEFYLDDYVGNEAGFVGHGFKAIEFLLKHGANPNGLSKLGRPLVLNMMEKADLINNTKLLDILLFYRLNLDAKSDFDSGRTALMTLALRPGFDESASTYEKKMASILLAKGANPDVQDQQGFTALHWAIRWANAPMALLLVKHTDLALRTNDGLNAHDFAMQRLASQPSFSEKQALVAIIRALR